MKRMEHSVYTAILVCFLLISVLTPSSLRAQIDTGGITGAVTDSQGAAIPGVTITLTNDATGVITQTKSTSTGTYSLNAIRPGTYTLRGNAPGFDTFVDNGLQVHIQNILTVNMPLITGNVKQQVTVTAAAPLLQSENAAVGQTVTTQAINDLPLNGRDWGSLAQLSAGVSTAPVGAPSANSGTTGSAYYSVDGVNLWQNDYRLNGINDNIEVFGGSSVGSNAAIIPPPDAIEEFKLQNGDFNAEFGHSTGAVVNAAIKSGTNQLHGDLWEYLRNDAFDANLFFNRNQPVAEYRQNQFGGTIGGPVYIPKIYKGKDRTFFFFDYQGDRIITPVPATSTVPTAGMVSSGFTNLQDLITYSGGTATDALGRTFSHGTILDPATTRAVPAGGIDPITGLVNSSSNVAYVRDPFYTGGSIAGKTDFTGSTAQLNIIPAGRIDPNAVKLLDLYPAPTASGLINNYFRTGKQSQVNNSYDIRIDETINNNNTLFGVYDRSLNTQAVPSALPGLAVGQTYAWGTDSYPAYAFAVGYNTVFTPTLTNEMHIGMVHSDKIQYSLYANTLGIPAQYGIGGVPQLPGLGGLPAISPSGLTGLGESNYTPTINRDYSIEGSDNVTKIIGRNTFKTGLQVDYLHALGSGPAFARGSFNFSGQYSDIPNQNSNLNGIADLLLIPEASTVPGGINNVGGLSSLNGSNSSSSDYSRWYWGAYFQDDWKFSPNLTLNLGIRWDYFTPYAEVNGRQANFIPSGGNGNTGTYYISNKGCQVARSASFNVLLTSSNITLDCVSGLALGQAQKFNFAPRVGFAYRIRPTLVVRGGYGTAYGALGNIGYGGTLGTNYPFVYALTFNSPDSQHPLLLPNGQAATLENSLTQINIQDPTLNDGLGLNMYGRQYNYQTPYTQTENLTVQDQFTSHDSIQVGYIGTTGRHLDNIGYNNSPSVILPPSINPQNYVPFPSFARNSTYETTNGTSSYNSMQATYEHQFSSGLSLLANYTWSKCMSDQYTQSTQTQGYRAEWLPGFGIKGDYGLCDTDTTNVVHVSGSYELPVGRGRTFLTDSNRTVDALLGGWAVNFIYSRQSGQPFTINCPVATSEFGCYAPVVSGQNIYAGPHSYTQWLNPKAFAQPPVATQIGQSDYSVLGGNAQQARGPGFNNLDSSVFKNFNFTGSVRLQFRVEAFNTTNTPQFGQPGNLNFSNPVGFSSITTMRNNPRLLQFALKLFY